MKRYNSAKDVPHFCKWGLGQITDGEHISRLARRAASAIGKMPQRKVCLWQTLIKGIMTRYKCLVETLSEDVLPLAKPEPMHYGSA